jgi:hypothetical protein
LGQTVFSAIAPANNSSYNSSDADSDVLADYVLALVRSDAPDEDIKRLSIDNLEDFLKESLSTSFAKPCHLGTRLLIK